MVEVPLRLPAPVPLEPGCSAVSYTHLDVYKRQIVIWGWLAVIWVRRIKQRRAFERLSITPDALHALILANHELAILDVRQPLDLLTDSEIIEGAIRLSPQDATDNPGLIPTDKELVVYCTCPSDKTSRSIALKAQSLAPNICLLYTSRCV